MRSLFELLVNGMLYAWRKQMNIPLPSKLMDASGERGDWGCAAFPLLGWLLGMFITLAGLLVAWIFNVYAGAIVFAVLGWLLFLYRDSGRSDAVFGAFMTGKLPGDEIQWKITMPIILMAGRVALLMFLFFHGKMWHLPFVTGGVFTLEALLTMDGNFMPPLLDDTPESRRNMAAMALVMALVSFVLSPMSTAIGTAFFMIIWRLAQRKSDLNGTDLQQITLVGGGAGWGLLLAGIFAI